MPADLVALIFTIVALIAVAMIVYLLGKPVEGTCHAAPDVPYDRDEAHWVLQDRINCRIATCAAKRAAYWALADLQAITPDPRVVR